MRMNGGQAGSESSPVTRIGRSEFLSLSIVMLVTVEEEEAKEGFEDIRTASEIPI